MVVVEGCADGGVVEGGVAGGHLRGRMTEHLLHDVLRDAGVDQPRPEGVTELVGGDRHGLTGLVAQPDVALPPGEPFAEGGVGERALAAALQRLETEVSNLEKATQPDNASEAMLVASAEEASYWCAALDDWHSTLLGEKYWDARNKHPRGQIVAAVTLARNTTTHQLGTLVWLTFEEYAIEVSDGDIQEAERGGRYAIDQLCRKLADERKEAPASVRAGPLVVSMTEGRITGVTASRLRLTWLPLKGLAQLDRKEKWNRDRLYEQLVEGKPVLPTL